MKCGGLWQELHTKCVGRSRPTRVLTPLSGVRDLFGEVVGQSGKLTQEFTPLRGSGLLAEYRGFPAIFARIYAVGLEWPGESAVPAAIG
jgi:hypothetical protein